MPEHQEPHGFGDGDNDAVLCEEHPDLLTSLSNLASTYQNQGQWREAEDLQVLVMETRKRALGEEHPDSLRSMNNLVSTYWNQGSGKRPRSCR